MSDPVYVEKCRREYNHARRSVLEAKAALDDAIGALAEASEKFGRAAGAYAVQTSAAVGEHP